MIQFLSIRVAPVLGILCVLVVTAVLCLTLTLTTSQSILESTRDVDRTSLDTTHDVARRNVETLANQLMMSVQTGAQHGVLAMLEGLQQMAHKHLDYARLVGMERAQSNEFFATMRALFFEDIRNSLATHILYTTASGSQLIIAQAPWTFNLRDPPQRPQDRTFAEISNAAGGTKSTNYTLTPLDGNGQLNASYDEVIKAVLSGANVEERVHGFPLELQNIDLKEMSGSWIAEDLEYFPSGYWGRVLELDWSVCTTFGAFYIDPAHSRQEYGNVAFSVGVGMDLRSLSNLLSLLPQTAGQRVFLAVAGMPHREQRFPHSVGKLVATSHGGASKYVIRVLTTTGKQGVVPALINVTESEDIAIRSAGVFVDESFNGLWTGLDANTTYRFRVANETGQEYFLRSTILNTGTGFEWALVVLAPLREIFEEVELNTLRVQRAVDQNNERLDDDANMAMSLTYLLLSLLVCLVITGSFIATTRYTRPLLQLRDEMAHVAVMEL
eukprot:PhM_4_TR15253/c1_g1_i1/m.8442